MKVQPDITYSVAPLERADVMAIVEELGESHRGAGVCTFEACELISKRLPDPSINACFARSERDRPCTTLCYVCIEVLYEYLLRGWERDRDRGIEG